MNAVVLAILASFFWGIGQVLQKHGMATNFPKISVREVVSKFGTVLKTLFSNWIWLIGLFFMLGGMASFATALGRGDITLVQPIVCLTGVVAAVIGVVFLRESLTVKEWFGVSAILVGVVLIGLAGGGDTAIIPGDGQIAFFTGLTVLLVIAALSLKRTGMSAEFTLSLAAGITFGLSNLMGKLLTQRASLEVQAPFSFGRWDMWQSLLTDYPFIIVILCNLFGSIFHQTAFANGRASVVAPIVVIISTVLPIVAALAIFGEQVQWLHGAGILVVLAGTAVLGMKKEEAQTAAITD